MFKDLEYFLAVSEEGNITKAAERLHIAQPSLTQKLQRMEKALGCTLLLRTNSGVVPTDAGKAYVRLARQVLTLEAGFLNELSQQKKLERGTLRVGASWYISTTLLPGLLTRYSRLYPSIELDCVEIRSSLLMEEIQAGRIDVAFVSFSPESAPQAKKHLSRKLLFRDAFRLVVSKDHPYAQDPERTEADLTQLGSTPFIMFRTGQRIRHITDSIFLQAGIRPPVKMYTYGFPLALEQAAAGNGAVILPEGYIASLGNFWPIKTFSLPERYHAFWDVAAVSPALDFPPPALDAFLRLLDEHFPKTV